jgi:hypothetical protein
MLLSAAPSVIKSPNEEAHKEEHQHPRRLDYPRGVGSSVVVSPGDNQEKGKGRAVARDSIKRTFDPLPIG